MRTLLSTVSASSDSDALSALASPVSSDPGVLLVERMTVDTACLRRVDRRGGDRTAPKVFGHRHGLKMFGVTARPVAAQMVKVEAFRYGAYEQFICGSVSTNCASVSRQLPVAACVQQTAVFMTAALGDGESVEQVVRPLFRRSPSKDRTFSGITSLPPAVPVPATEALPIVVSVAPFNTAKSFAARVSRRASRQRITMSLETRPMRPAKLAAGGRFLTFVDAASTFRHVGPPWGLAGGRDVSASAAPPCYSIRLLMNQLDSTAGT